MNKMWLYFKTQVLGYLLKFGVVGLIGLLIDLSLFNFLRIIIYPLNPIIGNPLVAKIISTIAAVLMTWLGNRYWTFRKRRRPDYMREFFEFSSVALGGMLISLVCLWFSHYVLGLQTVLADNISANVVGFFLSTVFRFTMYRYWVFGRHVDKGLDSPKVLNMTAAELSIYESEELASKDSTYLVQNLMILPKKNF